jgi:UDP-2,4-diacetamido-2,4,6-trideoxy-beta-L-altropyranose hydrolase
MNVTFRTDASLTIGHGHVMRCLALAETLCEHGARVSFVCREDDGHLCDRIEQRGFIVCRLSVSKPGTQVGDIPTFWTELEYPWEEDVDLTSAALDTLGEKPDWLVVDHYGLDTRWETALRPYAQRVMVIDDLANRTHNCDALLDPTYRETAERYRGLLPSRACYLCGSQYALLRPQFRRQRQPFERTFPRVEDSRVHVFFGGTDLGSYAVRFSRLLLDHVKGVTTCAVLSRSCTQYDQLRLLAGECPGRFSWKVDVQDMAASMANCDFALGAPGGATWERACIGLPTVYLAVSSSQAAILERLSLNGLCVYLGMADEVSDHAFVDGMKSFFADRSKLEAMRTQGMRAVDGNGVVRIATFLEGKGGYDSYFGSSGSPADPL